MLSLALASATSSVRAQDPYRESDARGSVVGAEVIRARRARDARRWAEAEDAYRAALAAAQGELGTDAQRAEIMGELGLCELALHKFRDSAEHFALSLQHRAALNPMLRRRIEEGRHSADAHVARLYLGVSPSDAEVLTDGRAVGRPAPSYELFMEPGQHTVRATLAGHVDALSTFEAGAGKVHTLSLELPRASDLPASASDPPASARPPVRTSVPVAARATPPEPWYLQPRNLRIAGIALTTATGAAGAVFLVRSAALSGDMHERDATLQREGWTPDRCVHQSPPACTEVHDLRTQRTLFLNLGTATLITSGVIGAVTAASYFTDLSFLWKKPQKDGLRIVPVTTGQQTGLWVHGVW